MRRFWATLLIATAVTILAVPQASAAETLAAKYKVFLDKVEIGKTILQAVIGPEAYSVTAKSDFSILFVWSAEMVAKTQGKVIGDRLEPSAYQLVYDSWWSSFEMSIDFSNGDEPVVDFVPPREEKEIRERFPIEDGDLAGAIDPLTGILLMQGQPTSAAVNQAFCDAIVPVFSGFSRFDVTVNDPPAEPLMQASSDDAVHCGLRYRPISGHRIKSKEVPRLASNERLSVEMSQIDGTSVYLPERVHIPVSLGLVRIERDHDKD